jgi:nucleotide-binding universal stress UspA family protein
VLGRHGARSGDGAIQATAERVIRKGDVPVLLASGVSEAPYRRTLVAVDLSDASHRVGELALALLPDDARALRAIHAYHVPFEGWFGAQTIEEQRRACEESARTALRRFEAMFEPTGIACRSAVRKGDPGMAILREVLSTRAELVVLGTHGRSGVALALLGSVAEWLVRAAPCDVAVTRPARFTFELP